MGAPTALHVIVASFPSKTVTFWGAVSMTGIEAEELEIERYYSVL